MARTALSKNTTYTIITTNVRNEARITTTGYSLMTDAYIYQIVNNVIRRVARILTENNAPFYRSEESLTIVGTQSPYTASATALSPYWNRPVRLTHVTTAGVRTPVNLLSPMDAESRAKLSNASANTINAVQLGWGFMLFAGSGVTITTATDSLKFSFDSQPITSTTAGDYLDVPDSLVPMVQDEVIEYLIKYQGLATGEITQEIRNQRYQQAIANV